MNIKIKNFGNINDDINYYYNNSKKRGFGKINLKRISSIEYSPSKRKSKTRNKNFRFLTSIHKISKDIPLTNNSFAEIEEESIKTRKKINNKAFRSLNTLNPDINFVSHFSESIQKNNNRLYLKDDIGNFKENTLSRKNLRDRKFMTLKNFKISNFMNEEKNNKENNLNKFYSFENNNIKNKKIISLKNKKYKSNLFLGPKNKIKLTETVMDEYITKMARISNENSINYNSGHFRIPLIGVN